MAHDELTRPLLRLLIGMADQEIRAGKEFRYDGGRLHADEVGALMLPSVLCIAQDLSDRLGLGSFGYQFALRENGQGGFPLAMEFVSGDKRFFEVSPFVAEVFEGEVLDCCSDLARLFESAARLIDPEFALDRDSNYGELAA